MTFHSCVFPLIFVGFLGDLNGKIPLAGILLQNLAHTRVVNILAQILGSMVNLLYFGSKIIPEVSKEQNRIFLNF